MENSSIRLTGGGGSIITWKNNRKVLNGDSWQNFAIVSNKDDDFWLTQRFTPEHIREVIDNPKYSDDYHVEAWYWTRKENGDDRYLREKLCSCCFDSGRKGMIFNAYQWTKCPVCNPSNHEN